MENKDCFISIFIDARMLHFRGVRVVKDSDSVIVFLDKAGKIRSYNRVKKRGHH